MPGRFATPPFRVTAPVPAPFRAAPLSLPSLSSLLARSIAVGCPILCGFGKGWVRAFRFTFPVVNLTFIPLSCPPLTDHKSRITSHVFSCPHPRSFAFFRCLCQCQFVQMALLNKIRTSTFPSGTIRFATRVKTGFVVTPTKQRFGLFPVRNTCRDIGGRHPACPDAGREGESRPWVLFFPSLPLRVSSLPALRNEGSEQRDRGISLVVLPRPHGLQPASRAATIEIDAASRAETGARTSRNDHRMTHGS